MLPESLLSALSELVAKRTGLHFPRGRWEDLQRGIAEAAPEFALPDAEACARWLLSAPLTHNMNEVLARHLSIGETYFIREKPSLDIFSQELLPQLLQARRQERRLRIWSAGCSTGEEAYTIAILLDRLVPDIQDWNVSIIGTDFNSQSLRKAVQGVYGEWSFRGAPGWLREAYFTQLSDGRFEIVPRIRKMVAFSYLNLVDDIYPSLANNTSAMDIIFCRNVLMYFTPGCVRQVVDKLYRAMIDGGWLIVSPQEATNSLMQPFEPVDYLEVVLYRKRLDLAAPLSAYPLFCEQPAGPRQPVSEPVVELHDVSRTEVPADWPVLARRCADQGRLDEALAWCNKAIAADKMNPEHHYLHATILQENGHFHAAAYSLRSALYLEPRFVLAHFALGNVQQMLGNYREARRCFSTVLELLHGHAPDEELPQADGLTAARLAEITGSLLESLPATAAI